MTGELVQDGAALLACGTRDEDGLGGGHGRVLVGEACLVQYRSIDP